MLHTDDRQDVGDDDAGSSGADEAPLVGAAVSDPEAFDRLYRAYATPVYRYVRSLTGNDEDAADVTQQVFLQAWRALDTFQGRSSFSTWLFRIARNRVVDTHRRRHDAVSWEQLPSEAHPVSALDLEGWVLRQERMGRLQRLVSSLAPEKREMLMLRFAAQLSVSEIASVMGKRPEAVKKQLLRTLRMLKEQFHEA